MLEDTSGLNFASVAIWNQKPFFEMACPQQGGGLIELALSPPLSGDERAGCEAWDQLLQYRIYRPLRVFAMDKTEAASRVRFAVLAAPTYR